MTKPTGPIALSPSLHLPADAVTQTFACIARRGHGKTYAAQKLAEEMLAAGDQIVAIDPVGVWYALRLAGAGGAGFDIPVFGGEHGDLPLSPDAGKLIAQVLVERGCSAVLDVSGMRKGERTRFLTDLGEELVHRKKVQRSPMHIFLEEAQTVVPQRPMPGQERLIGAWQDMVLIGRNFGVGITLISQRPQLLHKDVLNQTECLLVGQLTGPQERKTIEGWIVEQGLDLKALVAELPSLPRGTMWVWSPQWLGITVKVKIGAKRTFDGSRTPDATTRTAAPAPLDPEEVSQLREQLHDLVEEAEQNNPIALRRRIAELEAELAEEATAPEPVVEVREVPMIAPELVEYFRSAVQLVADNAAAIVRAIEGMPQPERVPLPVRAPLPPITIPHQEPVQMPAPSKRQPGVTSAVPDGVSGPQVRLLTALRWHQGTDQQYCPKVLLAFLAGVSPKSSAFGNNLGALRTRGLIDYPASGMVALTEAGEGVAGAHPKKRLTTAALQAVVLASMTAPQRRILEHLIRVHPRAIDRAALADLAGASAKSSAYGNNLGALRSLGFLDYTADRRVIASGLLFLQGS